MTKEEFIIKLFIGGNFETDMFTDEFCNESFMWMEKEYDNKIVWGFIGKLKEDTHFTLWFESSPNKISREFHGHLNVNTNKLFFKEYKSTT